MAIVWLTTHYHDCPAEYAKKTVLGKPTNFHILLVKIVDKYIDKQLLSSSYQFSLSLSPCSNVELREFFNEIGLTWEKQNFVRSKEVAVKLSRMCRKIGTQDIRNRWRRFCQFWMGTDGGRRIMMRSICSEEEKAFWKEVWLVSVPLKPGWVRIWASASHTSLYLCLTTISCGNVNSKVTCF